MVDQMANKYIFSGLFSILLVMLFPAKHCFADDFYSDHAKGWHWYDDPVPVLPKKDEKLPKKQKDANEIISDAQEKIKTALNNAIVNPSVENVRNYISLQNEMGDRAQKFSSAWRETLLQYPELDYSIDHPTSSVGIQTYNAQESNAKDAAIQQFAKQTGLFFFYKSTCPYCHRFAPILKSFAERNGVTVIAITMDGVSIPEFPDSKIDNGQAAQFHVTVTPSLFAVNPYTKKAYPVAYGLVSETDIRDAIYRIMDKNRSDNT